MINEIYSHIVTHLSSFLGTPSDLPSGNGTRFKDQSKLVITVYHSNINSGNLAEIAIKEESIVSSCGYTELQAKELLHKSTI